MLEWFYSSPVAVNDMTNLQIKEIYNSFISINSRLIAISIQVTNISKT